MDGEKTYTEYLKWKFGFLKIKASGEFLLAIEFQAKEEKSEPNQITNACKQQLMDYFDKKLTNFDLPLNPAGTEFQKIVWNKLIKIGYGKTISYDDLSHQLGDPKKIRAAASANGKNPIPIIIPCHRVIGKDGSLTGYAGGLNIKKYLLDLEAEFIQTSLF